MPKTSRSVSVHPLCLREVEVVRTVDITPGMRRVTLAGDQLGAFTAATGLAQPGFVSSAFDDDIRLFFTAPGQAEPVLPLQHGGTLKKNPGATSRVYTVRRWDGERGEVDVDFVKHGTGIATTWACRAKPGDRVHFVGPRISKALPESADWLLVAGDDTALPAIGRLLDELDEGARAQVFIEIAEESHRQQLPEAPGVEVTWLVRDGAEPGTSTLLSDAVRATSWWDGQPFAWIAGEQAVVRELRRHLVEDRGVPKEDVEFTGYWRRSAVTPLATDEALPDPAKAANAFRRFHELSELVPPIAIRVAAELGIGDLISRGVTTSSELAATTGSDERALSKLLRYLHAIDLLCEAEPARYGLTEVGEYLADEVWVDLLSPTGVVGRQALGIYGLAESIRTGQASYASVTGQDFATTRTEQEYEDRFLDRIARFQPTLAEPIAKSDILTGIENLVIHSGGAGAQAREFVAVHPQLSVIICALPAQADWLRRDLPATIPDERRRARVSIVEQSMFEPSPAADAVLFVRALGSLRDADAAHALRRATENLRTGGRVLLVEDTFDADDLDEHDGEADLLALTRHGSGLRTESELAAVIHDAGLQRVATHTVGWGTPVHELTRADA